MGCSINAVENQPLISVIVPVYNTAPWLRKCLDSICGQTYQNLEILCVNDGSTDESAEILAEYAAKDSRIKVFTQENAGLSAARNTGLEHATGEWVTGVDSDDWIELDAYELAIQHTHRGIDLVCFGAYIDGDLSGKLRTIVEEYYTIKQEERVSLMSRVLDVNVSFWNKLWRRTVIEENKIRFPRGLWYEDAAFFYCMAAFAGDVYFITRPLYHYVRRGSSIMGMSAQKALKCLDHLRIVEFVCDFYKQHQVLDKMRYVLDFMFDDQCSNTLKTLPESMHDEVRRLSYDMAVRMDVFRNKSLSRVNMLRNERFSALHRAFHWYKENRECFGVFGKAIYSIAYEKDKRIHRVLGKVVMTENKAARN